MTDRDEFEAYARTWLWMVDGAFDRLGYGGPYRVAAVQFGWQCWVESRRCGFVSSSPIDLELP